MVSHHRFTPEPPSTERAYQWIAFRDDTGQAIGYVAKFLQRDKVFARKLAQELCDRGISRNQYAAIRREPKLDEGNYYSVHVGMTKPFKVRGDSDYDVHNHPHDDVGAFEAWVKDHAFFQAMQEAHEHSVNLSDVYSRTDVPRQTWAPNIGQSGPRR